MIPAGGRSTGRRDAAWDRGSVSYNEILRVWEAGICIDRKMKRIGEYTDEVEAARAYDREAYRRFGEFAWLNFPEEVQR